MMNLRMVQFATVIDIGRLDSLRGITVDDGELRIGALTTHNVVLGSDLVAQHAPLIVEAYHDVAHHSVRNRGTLGGSLCHNDPASEMPLIMTIMGARLIAQSISGTRMIPVEAFIVDAFTTALEPGELLTEIRIPLPPSSHGHAFAEISQRKGDFGLVVCAAQLMVTDRVCRDVRIGYRNVGTATLRIAEIEAVLEGHAPDGALIAEAAATAQAVTDPPGDMHASAEYRRDIIGTLTKRVLTRAIARARQS
jgi:CO/xanthine dehydrogenase FAD-binding subunit